MGDHGRRHRFQKTFDQTRRAASAVISSERFAICCNNGLPGPREHLGWDHQNTMLPAIAVAMPQPFVGDGPLLPEDPQAEALKPFCSSTTFCACGEFCLPLLKFPVPFCVPASRAVHELWSTLEVPDNWLKIVRGVRPPSHPRRNHKAVSPQSVPRASVPPEQLRVAAGLGAQF